MGPQDQDHASVPRLSDLASNPFVAPTDKCPVNELPPEILAHIFAIGTVAQQDGEDDEMDTDIEDDDGDENFCDVDDDDDDDDDEMEFQVLVSHVCRHWRQVATQTPALWTHLTFQEPPPFEKSQLWIERSKGCPLTIEVDATKTVPDALDLSVDEEDEEDASEDAHERQRTIDELTLSDMAQGMDILMPHVARWQHFELMVSDFALMHLVLQRIAAAAGAPLLETLHLYHYEDTEAYDAFEPRALIAPLLPFHGNAPRLREVALWGVHIVWDDRRLLSGLTSLELAYHAMDVRPSFDDLAAVLQSSPQMDTLTLCCSGPAVPADGADAWPLEPISLPSLRNLVLAFQEPEYATPLVRRLHLPALQSLALDFESSDYTDFVKQLCAPMPVPATSAAKPRSLLAGLEHLKLSGLPCAHRTIADFYGALPNLRSLNINMNHLDIQFLVFLAYPFAVEQFDGHDINSLEGIMAAVSALRPESLLNAPAYCPLLETLTTTGVNGEIMRAWVKHRAESGHPIKRLLMNEDDEVSSKDYEYLKANLEDLEFFEGSDEETDEELIEVDEDEEPPLH